MRDWTARMNALVMQRNNLTDAELQDLMQRVDKLRDDTLKGYIATLVGWGDLERAELAFFIQLAQRCMAEMRPSKLRQIVETIEIQRRIKA